MNEGATMTDEERELMDKIVTVAEKRGAKDTLSKKEAVMLNSLWHAPPFYVEFTTTHAIGKRLQAFPSKKINQTLIGLVWDGVTRTRKGASGLRFTQRMAFGMLCLFDRDIRKIASKGEDIDDL